VVHYGAVFYSGCDRGALAAGWPTRPALEGTRSMRWRHAVAAMVLLTAPCTAHADAEIESFLGEWRGIVVSVGGAEEAPKLSPADLDTAITEENGGFRIRGLALGREPDGTVVPRQMDATFVPTDTPGVFAFEPGSGGLLSSLFADPAVGNPLEGDTLLWARVAGDTLHVYSLAIDTKGGYALEQSTGKVTGDGMVTKYELRLENDRVVTVEGRLERGEN
jgi:hypothetical protein